MPESNNGLDVLRSLIRDVRNRSSDHIEDRVETDMVRLVSYSSFPPDKMDSKGELRINSIETDALSTLANEIYRLSHEIQISEEKYQEYVSFEDGDLIAESPNELEGILRSVVLADKIYLFFTLCASLIESVSIELLVDEIMEEEYRGRAASIKFIERLNQKQRNELLLRTGVIDTGLKGEIDRIRRIRNNMVHEVRQRFLNESIEYLDEEIERGIRAINRLHFHYNGVEPLGWVKIESEDDGE